MDYNDCLSRDEEERQLDFITASKEFVNPPNIKRREQTKRMRKGYPMQKMEGQS
jgi:hypothetical protein